MQVLLSGWSLETLWDKIAHYIFHAFYWVLAALSNLCNIIINLVRALAGLESYWYNGTQVNPGESGQGDIVINFLQEQGLINIFIALFVLAIVLLFIVTFVAVIKSEWSPVSEAKGNNKFAVISKSIRALINFITVPVVAILGIIVGNELLKAFDGATQSGGDIGISNLMMQCVTENAAWAYVADSDARLIINENATEVVIDGETYKGIYSQFKSPGSSSGYDYAAINRAFSQGLKVSDDVRITVENIPWLDDNVAEKINDKIERGEAYFSYQDVEMVSIFFKLGNVDYLAGLIVMSFVTMFLFKISFGLVKRIYSITILILISPPIVAVTPIQPDVLKNWRKHFISNVLSTYGVIVGCNLFFILIPYLRKIQLFKPGNVFSNTLNSFVTLLFIAAGTLFISDLAKMIGDIIGGGDLYSASVDKSGKSLWADPAKKVGGTVSGVFGAPIRGARTGVDYFKVAKHSGWSEANKALGDDAKNALAGTGTKILQSSGFLQGLTGGKVNKDGKVTGLGSTIAGSPKVGEAAKNARNEMKNGGRLGEARDWVNERIEALNADIASEKEEIAEIDKRAAEKSALESRPATSLSTAEAARLATLSAGESADTARKTVLDADLGAKEGELDTKKGQLKALKKLKYDAKNKKVVARNKKDTTSESDYSTILGEIDGSTAAGGSGGSGGTGGTGGTGGSGGTGSPTP